MSPTQTRPRHDSNSVRAIVLAGGRGTRLAPYTSVLPKPLMPIGNRSILEIVVEQLARSGFRDVTLSVGYLSHLIRAVFEHRELSAELAEPKITYVYENVPLGTAGPLRLIDDLTSTFLVMNGDLLTDLDYAELIERHCESGSTLTIATQRRTTRMDYGVLHLDGNQGHVRRVQGYEEKPTFGSDVSMGIYVLEPRALEFIPPDGAFDFPDLVHALLRAGEPVAAFPYQGLWFDIGRHEDYERALIAWESSSRVFGGSARAPQAADSA